MRLEPKDIADFRKFLYERSGAPGLIDDALMKTTTLIDRAAQGRYFFRPAELFRRCPKVRERLEGSIRLATGAEVKQIVYATLAKPDGEGLEWLPAPLWHRALHEGLMEALGKRVPDFLRESRGDAADELAEDVWTKLWSLTGLDLWTRSVGHAEGTYGACLVEYLCAAVRADAGRKDRLEPLIDAMNYCLPLGQKSDDPTAWIVLTA